jgi:hypothetical protein
MAHINQYTQDELESADLIIDAIYMGGRSANSGDDPLSCLIGVSNQGGFRYLGNLDSPRLIVLTSSFNDPDWPDNLDSETGVLTYFGDNKKPGCSLLETPRKGNKLLQNMFNALHVNPPRREDVAPILVFSYVGMFRDMVFRGLAVPGSPNLTAMEDLVAIWKIAKGKRFQNYRAYLTLLDVPYISRAWLNDIKEGIALSKNCPPAWKRWINSGVYMSLKAERALNYRKKADQIPETANPLLIINTIYEYFKENPFEFEACAASIVQMMDDNFMSFNLTRPSRDGGRDAIGLYRIGIGESAILVDFALEAKCYNIKNPIGVRELSRLISRLKQRQFGIMVTTSYLNEQAYKELKEDGHPVIIIAAKDIIDIFAKAGLNEANNVSLWLRSKFPK